MSGEIEQVLKVIKATAEVEPESLDWIEKRGMTYPNLYSLSLLFFKEYKKVRTKNSLRFYFPLEKLRELFLDDDELSSIQEQINDRLKAEGLDLDLLVLQTQDGSVYYEQYLCYVICWKQRRGPLELKFAQSFFAVDYLKCGIISPDKEIITKDDIMKLARVIKDYNLYHSSQYIDFTNLYCTQVKTEIDYLIEHRLFDKDKYFQEYRYQRLD